MSTSKLNMNEKFELENLFATRFIIRQSNAGISLLASMLPLICIFLIIQYSLKTRHFFQNGMYPIFLY